MFFLEIASCFPFPPQDCQLLNHAGLGAGSPRAQSVGSGETAPPKSGGTRAAGRLLVGIGEQLIVRVQIKEIFWCQFPKKYFWWRRNVPLCILVLKTKVAFFPWQAVDISTTDHYHIHYWHKEMEGGLPGLTEAKPNSPPMRIPATNPEKTRIVFSGDLYPQTFRKDFFLRKVATPWHFRRLQEGWALG